MRRNRIGTVVITVMLLSLLTGISGAAPACVADNGAAFFCGATVTKSCTLNGSMICSSGHGLVIGADNVTIDGNGYTLDGVVPGICTWGDRSGIYNKGHDDAVITNLEIKNFCNGIYLHGVYRDTIENCNIHHNGDVTSSFATHGIKMKHVFNSTIRNNSIHHTIAPAEPNPGCEDGGNGLFLYEGDYNNLTGNEFYNNTKGGILIKMKPRYNNISHNHLWANGQGGIILRCCLCNFNLIEYNNASDNYGSGIFIGGNNNTIRDNIVCNNRDGGPYYADNSVGGHGYGINVGRGDGSCFNNLISNMICGNDYKGIYVVSGVIGNNGYENACDTTENYNDEETAGCTYGCDDNPGCVTPDGTVYRCGDVVMKSCTFNGTLVCPAGPGLTICTDNIVIDGNGFEMIGNVTGSDCSIAITSGEGTGEGQPANHSAVVVKGNAFNPLENVVLKNLTIEGFCTGIALKNVKNVTVIGCKMYDNGKGTHEVGAEAITHGIHMVGTQYCNITGNEIYNNNGTGCGCGSGGNGIFMYGGSVPELGDYNNITGNKLYDNRKAGFFMKMKCMHNNISYNTATGNGVGGIILRCCMSDFNLIEHNNASANYGTGIFLRGTNNTVRYNTVNNNMNGSEYVSYCSIGDPAYYVARYGVGILVASDSGTATAISNNVCGNDAFDIEDRSPAAVLTGDENACNTTLNYDDAGTTGCTYSCSTPPTKGDLNGDGVITPADALIALQMAVRGECSEDADVSGDRKVTSLDALMILQAAAGM